MESSDNNLESLKSPEFTELVNCLRAQFQPLKVYAFGSRVKGLEKPGSDFDVMLIIKDSPLSNIDRMKLAEKILWGKVWIPADIFIYTEKEFEDSKNIPGTVAQAVALEGKELDFI